FWKTAWKTAWKANVAPRGGGVQKTDRAWCPVRARRGKRPAPSDELNHLARALNLRIEAMCPSHTRCLIHLALGADPYRSTPLAARRIHREAEDPRPQLADRDQSRSRRIAGRVERCARRSFQQMAARIQR